MTVLVIGAKGTIGQTCAKVISAKHAVIASDISLPNLPGTDSLALDVTKADSVREAILRIDETTPLSGLVYAAGLNTTGFVDSIDWNDYERVMAVNLRGAFNVGSVLRELLRMRPRSLATVFISSTAGLTGEGGGSIYCASKFGLIGFTESFASEIAPFGGRANVLCPGNVDSPMLSLLAAKIGEREGFTGEEMLDQWMRSSAYKRLITPEEVARTCAWLISSDSSGISGQTIIVDGPRA